MTTICRKPGCPAIVERGYCAQHQRVQTGRSGRHRGTRQQEGWDNAWLRLSRAAIAAQPWCSRCGATTDLTADHIVPLSRGGKSVAENVQVLCRSCNSRKGTR